MSSQVANLHGLNYNNINSVNATTDKFTMREFLNNSSLEEFKYFKLNKKTDLKN